MMRVFRPISFPSFPRTKYPRHCTAVEKHGVSHDWWVLILQKRDFYGCIPWLEAGWAEHDIELTASRVVAECAVGGHLFQ